MKHFLLPLLLMSTLASSAFSQETPAADSDAKLESAVIGGGCFWCTEGVYLIVPGVKKVVSGYSGGHTENPTYKEISHGDTGHAEVIRIDYDPSVISYKDIIELFWYAHDPTTLNRQGADVGTQYRSVIYYANDEQKKIAVASKAEHNPEYDNKIVTEISPLGKFYVAEDYHQDFANKNPNQGYVCAVVKPKIEKFKKKLAEFNARQKTLP